MSQRRCRYCRKDIAPKTAHRPMTNDGTASAPLWECLVTGTAVAVLSSCPRCGGFFDQVLAHWQPTLFRHGGHGETTATVERRCGCGWSAALAKESRNPRVVS